MGHDQNLTPTEMANALGISTKTFLRDVAEKGIPYFLVGKRKRFDPEQVNQFLRRYKPERKVLAFPVLQKRRRSVISKKFAEAR
jgi:excisionase family DNA binding protein